MEPQRPNSAPGKALEVIVARQTTPVSKSKPRIKKGKLQRVSKPHSNNASLTSFAGVGTQINSSEKERLELLTTNPLKSTGFKEISDKNQECIQTLKDKEDQMKQLQSYLNSMQEKYQINLEDSKEPQEPTLEESVSQIKETINSIQNYTQEVQEREKRVKEIQNFTEQLRTKKDEEGNPIVEFPENFDEIVDTSHEYRSVSDETVNWIEVYQKRKELEEKDQNFKQRMQKIKELDALLNQKEQQVKSSRGSKRTAYSDHSYSPTPSNRSLFFTGVRTKTPSYAPSSSKTTKSDKIQKNIELAGSYKGHHSLIDKLTTQEKQRIDKLLENSEGNLYSIEEYTGIMSEEQSARLKEIENSLKKMNPQLEWKDPKELNQPKKPKKPKKSKKPGEPALQAVKESRETANKLKSINNSLMKLRQEAPKPLTEEELNKLVSETALVLQRSSVSVQNAILDEKTSSIEHAKTILEKVQELENLNTDELQELLEEAQHHMDKYQQLAQLENEELQSDPKYQAALQKLNTYIEKCSEQEKDLKETFKQLENVEFKLGEAQKAIQKSEEFQKSIDESEVEVPEFPQPTLEELDQEMESKILDTFEPPPKEDPYSEFTPEDLPALYYMLQRGFQET